MSEESGRELKSPYEHDNEASPSSAAGAGGDPKKLKRDTKKDKLWPGNAVEMVISTLVAVQKTIPVPGLGSVTLTLAELLRAVDDTKENRKAFGRVADEAMRMVTIITEGCKEVIDSRNSNSSAATISQLESHVKAFKGILEEIRDTARQRAELPPLQRFWTSRKDPGLEKQYREKLATAINQFQVQCDISNSKALGRIEDQLERLRGALERSELDSVHQVMEPAPQVVITGPGSEGPSSSSISSGSGSQVGTEGSNIRPRSSTPNSRDEGGSSTVGSPSPSPNAADTAAPSSPPPLSRASSSSNPFASNPFRPGGIPAAQSPSPTPAATPYSNPAPSPTPFSQPHSPPPSQTSPVPSMSIFQGASGISIAGNISMNHVTGDQHNVNNSPSHHVLNNGHYSTNVNQNSPHQFAFGPNGHNQSTNPSYGYHSHYYPHPHPPPPPHGQWGQPPPSSPQYHY